MLFPETTRILYKKNPLEEVICQLRFPTILKIEKEIPYELQEAIRNDFPEYSESNEIQIPLPGQKTGEVPSELVELAKNNLIRKNYMFLSVDKKWKVNLTRDFITLSTVDYSRWEEFRNKILFIIDKFENIYNPSYFSRLGLRYIDIISRENLGLTNVSWSELLNPAIIGLLGEESFENQVENLTINTLLDLGFRDSKVRIQNGLVVDTSSKQKKYRVDSDFYTLENTKISESLEILDNFHECASRLIRWCITEKLHNAMEPKEL